MFEVGECEARKRFSELLHRTTRGERIAMTRRGERVAFLIPAGAAQPPTEVIAELRQFRAGRRFGGDLHAAVEEGRL